MLGKTSGKTEKNSEKPIQPRVCGYYSGTSSVNLLLQVQYSEEQLRERLTEEEYDVTQNKGTERFLLTSCKIVVYNWIVQCIFWSLLGCQGGRDIHMCSVWRRIIQV